MAVGLELNTYQQSQMRTVDEQGRRAVVFFEGVGRKAVTVAQFHKIVVVPGGGLITLHTDTCTYKGVELTEQQWSFELHVETVCFHRIPVTTDPEISGQETTQMVTDHKVTAVKTIVFTVKGVFHLKGYIDLLCKNGIFVSKCLIVKLHGIRFKVVRVKTKSVKKIVNTVLEECSEIATKTFFLFKTEQGTHAW